MKLAPTDQKLRGGYYTPRPIADFLARWAIQSPSTVVLEPSCGDGSLLEAAIVTLLEIGADPTKIGSQVHGIELDPAEALKADERVKSLGILSPASLIHVEDFFSYCQQKLFSQADGSSGGGGRRTFDAIIGNPPFIRYQSFPEEYRDIAVEIIKSTGMKPSRLMNAWLPFLITSSLLLKENGRLAMVIPAELFQVNYAAETRRFLSDFYHQITIVTFKKLVFADIQQEVVLLLCERGETGHSGVRTVEFEDASALSTHRHTAFTRDELKPLDHSQEKWTQYFLNRDEIQFLRTLKQDPRLTLSGRALSVDVGVVTGENTFFILSERRVKDLGLDDFVGRVVSRSAHLKGNVFRVSDWQENVEGQLPAFVLDMPRVPLETLPEAVRAYILWGEQQGFHTGYKCSIRAPWYVAPSLWQPEAFMLRQIHGYPKLVLNEAGATCTDTLHRVRFSAEWERRVVTASFMNVLTFAFAEVTGRSYGGGVLTFEPGEAERLPLPLLNSAELDLEDFDRLVRANALAAVLEITDRVLLKEGLGLDGREIAMLHGIWEKLRDRRTYRKR